MKKLLVALVCAAPCVPADAQAYRNPTPGAALVYQIPGMHRAAVRRNVVYRTVDGVALELDIYRPRGAKGTLPACCSAARPPTRPARTRARRSAGAS